MATTNDLDTVRQFPIKIEEELEKLQTFDSTLFSDKNILFDDSFQNIFVCQPSFKMLGLKKGEGDEYAISWKSKVLFEFKLLPLQRTINLIENRNTIQ